MRQNVLRSLAIAGVLGMVAACGGGGDSATGPNGNTLSATEAQTVAVNLFTEISKALSTATISPSQIAANHAANHSFSLAPTTLHETVNGSCTAGGTIKGNYTFTEDFGSNGSGTATGNMTLTSSGCKVSTGTRTIGVDGTYTVNFTETFTSASAYTAQYSMTGNFTWDGGSCSMNFSMSLNSGGHETASGSFCGQNISYSN